MYPPTLIFNVLTFTTILVTITAQTCPTNPECSCSVFVDNVPTVIACRDQGRTRIPVGEFDPSVVSLDFSGNNVILEAGQLRNLTQLRSLDLSRNSLDYIPADVFEGLVSLDSLTLDGNLLTTQTLVPDNFTGAQNISSLSLASNGLSVPIASTFFAFFTKLKTLNLDANLYQYLSPTFFTILSGTLEELIISNNLLLDLPVSIFSSLSQLILLDISGNLLVTLPDGIFSALNNTDISLAGNPWSCDCYLISLTALISSPGTLNFTDASLAFCAVPSNLVTMTLVTVSTLSCFAPSLITQPQDAYIRTTQNITFNCTNTGLPIPSVTWYHNGTFLTNSFLNTDESRISVSENGVLYITAVELSDEGMYYCFISNSEGDVNSSVAILTVEEITCFDNLTSPNETDRDCGGPYCTPCVTGQKCTLNRDCDNGICLYAHTIPSQLLYITKSNELAYTCNDIEVGTIVLQMRLASILFGTPNFTLNTSSNLDTVNQLVRQSLSSQLEIPIEVILDVNVMTIERYFTPLVQIYFYIEDSHYALVAQNLLLEQINTEKLRVTMKLDSIQNSISVRINF